MKNLNDYLNDAKGMIEIYSNPALSESKHPGNYFFFREHLLNMYLKVRRYQRSELALVKQILYSKVDYDSPDTDFKDLIKKIVDDINELSGPITNFVQAPVDNTYIENPIKFQLAEIWAFDNGFIDEESAWQTKKGYLGSFLNMLVDCKVIYNHSPKRTKSEIEGYFTGRYRTGALDTLLKRGKAVKHYGLFDSLEEVLKTNPD